MSETDKPQTAADIIQETAWRVNWKPDEKHSQEARYDALRTLMHIYAFYATVSLETLRRVDPEAAERVARYLGDDDLDWDVACENAWVWNERLTKGEPIDPDGWLFPRLTNG